MMRTVRLSASFATGALTRGVAVELGDTIITRHSATTMTWADLKKYADFNRDFRE